MRKTSFPNLQPFEDLELMCRERGTRIMGMSIFMNSRHTPTSFIDCPKIRLKRAEWSLEWDPFSDLSPWAQSASEYRFRNQSNQTTLLQDCASHYFAYAYTCNANMPECAFRMNRIHRSEIGHEFRTSQSSSSRTSLFVHVHNRFRSIGEFAQRVQDLLHVSTLQRSYVARFGYVAFRQQFGTPEVRFVSLLCGYSLRIPHASRRRLRQKHELNKGFHTEGDAGKKNRKNLRFPGSYPMFIFSLGLRSHAAFLDSAKERGARYRRPPS